MGWIFKKTIDTIDDDICSFRRISNDIIRLLFSIEMLWFLYDMTSTCLLGRKYWSWILIPQALSTWTPTPSHPFVFVFNCFENTQKKKKIELNHNFLFNNPNLQKNSSIMEAIRLFDFFFKSCFLLTIMLFYAYISHKRFLDIIISNLCKIWSKMKLLLTVILIHFVLKWYCSINSWHRTVEKWF